MVLACDADKPRESQPRIFAKTPTFNQQRKLIGLLSSLERGSSENKVESFSEKLDLILDTAASVITGWENISLEYNRDNIGEVLTLEEIIEVLTFLVSSQQATPDDKKKSDLPH